MLARLLLHRHNLNRKRAARRVRKPSIGDAGKCVNVAPLRILNSTSILVRKGGVEPPRPRGHRILSPARLPIPPLPHERHPALGSLFWRQVASFGPEVAGGTADAFPLD